MTELNIVERLDAKGLAALTWSKRDLSTKTKIATALSDFIMTLRCFKANRKHMRKVTPEVVVAEEFGMLPECQFKDVVLTIARRALV